MNLIETGDKEVNADSNPDLGAHGVSAGAIECFDAQVLLDPFEEEFDLPPALIDGGDLNCRELEVVGQKDETLSRFRIT